VGLTVIRNPAVRVFALVSVAEHVTTVRPIMKRLPDLDSRATARSPSTSSRPMTL
jgi:hypothetical protein